MPNIRASQIFTHTIENAVAAKKELDAGSAFSALVEKYSVCPSKKQGGDLGWMNEENAQSLLGGQSIQKGQTIGPIHSPYGYHILMITDVMVDETEKVFAGNTSMIDLNRKFPSAHSLLFKTFHIGLPVTGYKPEETISSVCKAHRKTESEVLQLLNSEYSKQSVPTISPQDLKSRINSGDTNLRILDIRERWEHDISRIENSQLVTRENSEDILGSLDKNCEIVLVDWKGDRSPSFQKWLAQRGFANVKGLEGGIDAWAAAIDSRLARYDIDEDKDYRYEDLMEESDVNHPNH